MADLPWAFGSWHAVVTLSTGCYVFLPPCPATPQTPTFPPSFCEVWKVFVGYDISPRPHECAEPSF